MTLPKALREYQTRYGLSGDAMVMHLGVTPTRYDQATDGWDWRRLPYQAKQHIRVKLQTPPGGAA